MIITLITGILDTFMFRLNVSLKITLVGSLIITLTTRILDSFMFMLNMFLKIFPLFYFIGEIKSREKAKE